MRINLALKKFQAGRVQTSLHLDALHLLLMTAPRRLIFLLQGIDIPFCGMFHLIKCLDQLSHLIPVFHHQVLAPKIISGYLPGTVGQFYHRDNQGIGQKLGQADDRNNHQNGTGHNHVGKVIEEGNLFLIAALSLLQSGLHQPSGIGLQIPLHSIYPVQPLHKSVLRLVHVKDLVPENLVAFIAVLNIPRPGIPLWSNNIIVKGQGVNAALCLKTGQPVLLCILPGLLPHIELKGFRFLLHGLLHIIAEGIVIENHVKTFQGEIHDQHIKGNGQTHYQNDNHGKCAQLFFQGD